MCQKCDERQLINAERNLKNAQAVDLLVGAMNTLRDMGELEELAGVKRALKFLLPDEEEVTRSTDGEAGTTVASEQEQSDTPEKSPLEELEDALRSFLSERFGARFNKDGVAEKPEPVKEPRFTLIRPAGATEEETKMMVAFMVRTHDCTEADIRVL